MANFLSSFFHPENAYKKAENESNLGWNQAKGYQQPFMKQGQEAYPGLSEAMKKLLNPGQLENEWAQGYETSPYAKQALAQNLNQGQEAASSMGLSGSSAALNHIQQGASVIQNQDRQQFLKDLMEKYMEGIGLGKNLYGIGAQTGANLGSQAIEHGNDVAGLEYGRQAAPGKLFENLVRGGVSGFAMTPWGQSAMGGSAFNQGIPGYMQKAIYGGG